MMLAALRNRNISFAGKMRTRRRVYARLLSGLACALVLAGCGGGGYSVPAPIAAGNYYGTTVPMGNGTVRTVVTVDANGKPSSVGVQFTSAALSGQSNSLATEFDPVFPTQVNIAPINNVALTYRPTGKFPPGTYDIPQIAASFFYVTPQFRQQITNIGNAAYNKLYGIALADEAPPTYFLQANSGAPGFGAHYVYFENPEFVNGGFTFSTDLLYYNSHMIGIEPFVALSVLKQNSSRTVTIEQPLKYPSKGYFPTQTRYSYDLPTDTYTIALDGLVYRN